MSRASEGTRDLIARAVHFDRFCAPLCVAIGSPDAEAILGRLARRALFLQSHPDGDGWFSLHGLVREFTLSRLPLPPDEVRSMHARAASWFEGEGLLEAALDARMLADDPVALAAFLSEHAPTLVLGGDRDAVFSVPEQRAVAEAIRGATLVIVPGVGHTLHWEDPPRFVSEVLAFLGVRA